MTTYRTIVGIDIGTRTVKAARVVRHGRRWKTAQTEMLRLPAASSHSPAPLVARWLETNGLSKYPLALSLSGQSVMFQAISLRDEDPRTMEQAAAVEVARFQELASEETVHAVSAVDAGDRVRRLLLIMARSALLDTLLQTYRDLGLNIVAIVPSASALFAFTAPVLRSQPAPYIVADVGPDRTDLGIGWRESLLFGRSIPGCRLPADPDGAATERDAALAAWGNDLQSGLSMYSSLYPAPNLAPRTLVLCGDACDWPGFGAAAAGLADFETLDLKERLAAGAPKEPHRFAVAAGAAISVLSGSASAVNLLPAAMREELLLKSQKHYWAATAVTGGLILAILMVGGYRNARRAQRHLEQERQVFQRCEELARQIETQKRRADLIFAMAHPIGDLLRNGAVFQDLIVAITAHRAPEDVITMISDAASYFRPAQTTPGTPAATRVFPAATSSGIWDVPSRPAPAGAQPAAVKETPRPAVERIIIEGYTPKPDLSTVRDLIIRLRETPFIDPRTDMLGDDKLVEDSAWTNAPALRNLRRFVIDVYLRPSEAINL